MLIKKRFAQANVSLKILPIMGEKADLIPEVPDSNPKTVSFYLKIVNCDIEEAQSKKRKSN